MSDSKIIKEIAALREAAIEDLMATSDAELRDEAEKNGEDFEAVAMKARLAMRESAAAFLRQRMNTAKVRSQAGGLVHRAPIVRPSVERIKQIIQQVFISQPKIGLAFREGKRQSESDWLSLYDDLVSMGAITEDEDGNKS